MDDFYSVVGRLEDVPATGIGADVDFAIRHEGSATHGRA